MTSPSWPRSTDRGPSPQTGDVTTWVLHVDLDHVTPATAMGDLGANGIKVVEIELSVQSDRSVIIDDDKIDAADGGDTSRLTVAQLAGLVREARGSQQ